MLQQATVIAALELGGVRGSGSQVAAEGSQTVSALFDSMALCRLDVVPPQPADAADAVFGKGRLLLPTWRSADSRCRDAVQSLQIAQMMKMMKVMIHHFQDVKALVCKSLQDHDPALPFRLFISYDTDDEE